MYDPFGLAMLGAEPHRVITLRLWKLAWGGSAGVSEAQQMVSEKAMAAVQSGARLMMGASVDSVVRDYRGIVQANIRRLSA